MKKLLTLLALSFLMMGCQSPTEETVVDETISSTDYAPEIDELLTGTASTNRDEITLLSSSELEDESSYGFSYAASSAIDQDLSTAWCPDPYDLTQRWGVIFNETVLPGTLGIQNGFARSKEIFFQNNRVKLAELYYDGELIETLEFEDTYDMQFFDLPDWPTSEISLYITEVYPGSKYDDTCISEVDFWSDYVQEKDADAAQLYYLDNKADDAIRPTGISQTGMTRSDAILDCGAPQHSYKEFNSELEYGFNGEKWIFLIDQIAFYSELSSDTNLSEQFTVKWLYKVGDTGEWTIDKESILTPSQCSDGSIYISDDRSETHPYIFRGSQKVELLHNGIVIASEDYDLPQ